MSGKDGFWIETVSPKAAGGAVRAEYDAALERAGRVWNIVRVMSPNPATLHAVMEFYAAILFGPSGLSRVQREALATVTSKANDCHY
jgi:alkylhydroperoxidase family enzyme